ncbi:MAG: membrane lipoprotein lipid attachment site-containing protein [Alistipes sp.]|nr:membrane lipoprotein lipid attachment site-containing protein [Alistipes sp.]
MKKIFFAIVSIFALSACIKEELPIVQQQNGEGDMVTLTFDVKVPEAGSAITRSMSQPKIERLDVLVFDHEGYFVGKAVATPNEDVTPKNPEEQQAFSVSLISTSNPRSIHFIANCPEAGNINFGHEDAFISNLMVDGDVDAYWQCMKFTNGIAEQANVDTTEDATIFSNKTVVPLVRNFARVSVTSTAANFVLTGFAVMNTRTGGTVAAYAQNKGEFVEYTKPSTTDNTSFVAKTYQELVSEVGYTGFEAGDLNDDVNNAAWVSPYGTDENGAQVINYLYVRETAAASRPCIIVKGKYNGGDETYYKLDFMLSKAANGTPMEAPVLRNFSYEFKITLVTKSGYTSAQAAYEGKSDNNLSADSATESLLNISDGASQLFVNATSVTLVSGDQYYLMYKYLPTIGGVANNSLVNIEVDNTDVTDPIFPEGALTKPNNNTVQSLYDAAVADGNTDLAAYYKEYLGYNYVILDPVDPKDVPLSQTVNVTAGNLYRKVNFDLRKKIDMTVAAYGEEEDGLVSAALNQKVNVDITIPKGLPHSIFPLEFVIEADALSIYPDAAQNNLPVRSGKSIITDKNETTFGFVKTYTLAEYIAAGGENNPVTINTYFLTNKAASATTVYVYNQYFALGSDDFDNSEPEYVNSISFSLIGSNLNGENRTVTVTSGDWSQTFTLNSNGSATNFGPIDISQYNLTDSSEVTISGSYYYWSGRWYYTYSCNYSTTIGKLNGAEITLNFEQQ